MERMNKALLEELISFYTLYLEEEKSDKIKQKAEEIYSKYFGALPLLDESLHVPLCKLVDVFNNTGIKPISTEESKIILDELIEMRN